LFAQGFPKSKNLPGGWGTALKPAAEDWWLARKPLAGTVASNVLKHGTGALNIDACRIATDWNEPDRPESWKRSGHTAQPEAEKIAAPPGNGIVCHPDGRWPANVVLSHLPGCTSAGTKRVRGSGSGAVKRASAAGTQGAALGKESRPVGTEMISHVDADGLETVEAWVCESGCPVAMLDEQSGPRRSSGLYDATDHGVESSGWATNFGGKGIPGSMYADSGGASRFFFCAKPSTSERSENVGENKHPTVKSVELMRWLTRLVCPPGGVVIDPFCGSGSGGVAAVREGFRFIGLEQEAEYVELARGRVGNALGPLFANAIGGSK
jgi:site-specific DNA-methyltransferase (adenine-specific)